MLLKRVSSYLPKSAQQELRRLKAHFDIARGRFQANDPEYQQLASWVKEGDWVIDIGANIGYYTWRLSHLVGKEGRVFAIEPIPETVAVLTSVLRTLPFDNVTVLNIAASDANALLHFTVPVSETHSLPDYFTARVANEGGRSVYSCAIDHLAPPHRVSFVKIDTEGHEHSVLQGMQRLIARDNPIIVLEGSVDCPAARFLVDKMGYVASPQAAHSGNVLLAPAAAMMSAARALGASEVN